MENLDVMAAAVQYNRFLEQQIELAAASAPGMERALDFGAGNGCFANAAKAHFSTVLAIEIDPIYQQRLRAMEVDVSQRLEYVSDGICDVAWSFNVLEHIQDDQGAINELVAKLRPGGRLVIFVPAFECLYSRMDERVGHVRRYRLEELRRKVASAGCHVLSASYVDSLGFFAAAAYRLVGGSGILTKASIHNYDRFVFPPSRLLDRIAAPFFGKSILLHAVAKPLPPI